MLAADGRLGITFVRPSTGTWMLCEDPSRCNGLAWGKVGICFFMACCSDAEHDFLGLLELNPEYSELSCFE